MRAIRSILIYFVLPAAILWSIYYLGWGAAGRGDAALIMRNTEAGSLGKISQLSPAVTRSVALLNQSASDATIAKIYTDCACVSVELPLADRVLGPFGVPTEQNTKPLGVIIVPNGVVRINFTFSPRGQPVKIVEATIFVETKDKKITKVPIKVEVVR